MAGLLALGVGLGAGPLLVHQRAEALLVDGQALLGRHLEGEVEREAVGVVQLEHGVARQDAAGRAGRGHGGVEDGRALGEGLQEGRLLGLGDRVDAHRLLHERRVLRPHREGRGVDQLLDHRLGRAHEAHGADGAAQDPAQHVAGLLVARRHAVADEHQRGADVVGDDAQPDVVRGVGAVADAGQLGRAVQDLPAGVDLVEVVDALQQRRDALQAHAGVDVLLRQRPGDVEVDLGAHLAELVLHEDEVPELHVPLAVDGGAALGAVLRPAVVEDLRAGAAGTGHAHVPVVVGLAEPLDARRVDADRRSTARTASSSSS